MNNVKTTNDETDRYPVHALSKQMKCEIMATRKLTNKERESVKNIFKDQRSAGRCRLVRDLQAQAKALTVAIDAELRPLEEEVKILKEKRLAELKDAHLTNFDKNGRYCSNNDIHRDLMAYDEETDRLMVKLLTEEKIPVDVKAVLTKALEAVE